MTSIHERIKDLMADKGLNGQQVATAIGVSFPAVSQWKNEYSNISIENIFRLAKLFDCSIDYLVGRTENESSFCECTSDFLYRLQELISKNNISLYRLNNNGILPKSTYYTWVRGAAPRLANLIPIADYFDCTLDYLLGC